MEHLKKICLLLAFLVYLQAVDAQVKKIWALGDGEKIFRGDSTHPDRHGNFTWDGKMIHLKGLFNEVVACQVIVEAGINAVDNIELTINLPVHKASGKTIGGNTLKYGPGGTIEVFTEHYLQVKDSTHPNWFYGSPAAAPKKMTGWIPDALIPTDATPGKGGFPVSIAPFQNQGFWIDISLPRDQRDFPAGTYVGNVEVREKGKVIQQLPLEIMLLPHYLTDENKTNIWLFTSDIYDYFPGVGKDFADDMIKFEAHRHRIDLAGGFNINQSAFNKESLDQYKPYLDGTAFTPSNGYYGSGEGIGEKIFPIGMYGSPVMGHSKDSVQKQSDLWVEWFKKNAPSATYFWYITDEPPEDRFPWIKERANWIKTNSGPGKSMPIFTTTAYNKNLGGAIDYWAGYNGLDLELLPSIREKGGDHWFYNGNRPRYGSVILEGAAVDFRVNSWILYKYNIKTWFIWHGTHWQHNGQGPKRHLHQNVFRNSLTFINDQMEYGNGDGIIFYPGHMPFYPEEDRGLNRVLPSVRLKNIRRGQQDAAIIWMAEQKAGRKKVMNAINKIVPKALSEVPMKDAVPWSEKGNDFDRVRDELLKMLL